MTGPDQIYNLLLADGRYIDMDFVFNAAAEDGIAFVWHVSSISEAGAVTRIETVSYDVVTQTEMETDARFQSTTIMLRVTLHPRKRLTPATALPLTETLPATPRGC